mgnify:CR=1 FL=1
MPFTLAGFCEYHEEIRKSRFITLAGPISSPAEARRFTAFCAEARRLYEALEGPYLRSERPTLGGLVGDLTGQDCEVWPDNWPAFTVFEAMSTQWRVREGIMEAMAGRSTCGRVRSLMREAVTAAPVWPARETISASLGFSLRIGMK